LLRNIAILVKESIASFQKDRNHITLLLQHFKADSWWNPKSANLRVNSGYKMKVYQTAGSARDSREWNFPWQKLTFAQSRFKEDWWKSLVQNHNKSIPFSELATICWCQEAVKAIFALKRHK
jgi:hypothetical protein